MQVTYPCLLKEIVLMLLPYYKKNTNQTVVQSNADPPTGDTCGRPGSNKTPCLCGISHKGLNAFETCQKEGICGFHCSNSVMATLSMILALHFVLPLNIKKQIKLR